MAKLIGTAGHVDHGKTTLIRALTGIDADRLPEEKRRGMTIDIGFAYIELPKNGRVSIVDVPGHEKFLRNMLVGAMGVDIALLCVASDEGVKPQTREHFQILELLPVQKMVVALTRADLADDLEREICIEEVRELLRGSRFEGSPIRPVSAERSEGLEELKLLLDEALSEKTTEREGLWYLAIDRAFNVKGHGCVVTGTVARGIVQVGAKAIVMPGAIDARVRGIQSHGGAAQEARAGQRAALNLGGVSLEQIQRGQGVGASGALFETSMLDARIRWLARPKHGSRVRLSIGSEEVIGRVFLSDADPAIAQLRLEHAVAAALEQPIVIRRYSPPDLLGGGEIIVPNALARRKTEQPRMSSASGDQAILELLGTAALGLHTEEICRRLGKTPQDLGDAFERLSASGLAKGFAGHWFSRQAFEVASDGFLKVLQQAHESNPIMPNQPRERIVEGAGYKLAGKSLDRFVSTLVADGRVVASGTAVRLPDFKIKLTDRQRAFLDRVLGELETEAVNTPTASEIASRLKAPIQAVEEVLGLGRRSAEVLGLPGGIWYTPSQFAKLAALLTERFGGEPFAVSDMRDLLVTSRKYAVPLAEYMDSIGFTTRLADKRIIRSTGGRT